MPRQHRYQQLRDEALRPTWTPPDLDCDRQVAAMTELRELSNQIAEAFRARDERLFALALSQSLSRRDMATATGLNKSRVDQIIREVAEEQRERWNAAADERTWRHLAGRQDRRG